MSVAGALAGGSSAEIARDGPRRARRQRLGLRARVTLSFAIGALMLCVALSLITYFTTRTALVNQAETSIEQQAYANATATESDLAEGFSGVDILNFIDEATSSDRTLSLLFIHGEWISPSPSFSEASLTTSLKRQTIASSNAFAQVVNVDGSTQFAVGVPITKGSTAYFGVFPLDQVLRTLHILLASLALATLLTTIAGAVLGRWVSVRALRPLVEVSDAALAIASGRLDTRLAVDDVRDLAVLAASFNRMADRLQGRIEREARFTSDVSHELRSPLTTLSASLSVIEARRGELDERSAQALDLISLEVRHFQQMVGDLLEISRLDAGVADFEPDVVEVGELVSRAVDSWGKDPVPVLVRSDIARRRVAVDKRRFERVMANLLDNAQRYAGGATRVLVERSGATMRVSVEDRGPGIALEERERIFERFARGRVTAGQRGAAGGTGLGLALVAEHVKLHQGRAFVEDHVGGGSAFVVEFPLAEESPSDEDELGSETAVGPPARRGSPVTTTDRPELETPLR